MNEKKQINDFFVDTYEARGTNAVKLMSLALEYNGERWCGVHPTVEDFLREKEKIGV